MTIEDFVAEQRRWLESGDDKSLVECLREKSDTPRIGNYDMVTAAFLQQQIIMEVALKLAETLDRLERRLSALENWWPR